MIVNNYSILMLFMAILGFALSLLVAGAGLWTAWQRARSGGQRELSRAERTLHLARLAAVVCLVVTALGWPLFYAMLSSFVAEVPGAMCVFGVTRVLPRAALLAQAAAPAAIFLLGAWVLWDRLRARCGLAQRRTAGLIVLVAVAAATGLAQATEVYYVVHMKSLNRVSCCSSYGQAQEDQLQNPSYYLPWRSHSAAGRQAASILFFAGIPLLALGLAVLRPAWLATHPGSARLLAVLLLAASMALAWVTLAVAGQVLAPRLMQLPFHHCVYCLVASGRVPDAPLIAANLGLGLLGAGWTAVLCGGLPPAVDPDQWSPLRETRTAAATLLLAGVLMIGVHLAIVG